LASFLVELLTPFFFYCVLSVSLFYSTFFLSYGSVQCGSEEEFFFVFFSSSAGCGFIPDHFRPLLPDEGLSLVNL